MMTHNDSVNCTRIFEIDFLKLQDGGQKLF